MQHGVYNRERVTEKSSHAKDSVAYDLVCLIIKDILVIRALCKYFETITFQSFVDLIIWHYPKLGEFKKYSTPCVFNFKMKMAIIIFILPHYNPAN
jgi:hypothetical protein